jgi:hypothetical protein
MSFNVTMLGTAEPGILMAACVHILYQQSHLKGGKEYYE